jgi:signal transduction histidine kinase
VKAKENIKASIKLSDSLNFKSGLSEGYRALFVLDSIECNYKDAFAHHKMYILYRDSWMNEENVKKSEHAKVQYEFDKKQDSLKAVQDKKDALATAEIKNQKLVRNFSLSGAFLIVSLGGYSFYRYRRRRKLQSQQEMLNERLRISRELHDDVGATLSGIAMYSHLAKEQLKTNQNAETERSLNVVHQSAGEMVNKLSDIVWLINPDQGSLKNLAERLEEYAINMASVKNMQVKVNISEQITAIDLPMEARRAIYLICKEAINNAVKYSEATLLELNIKEVDSTLMFTIIDNGKGFDTTLQHVQTNVEVLGGNGLKNMRARAENIHATFNIHSKINEGTKIQLVVTD